MAKEEMSPQLARAMKRFVKNIGGKNGISSISLQVNGGDEVVIDEAAAKRITANADAIIKKSKGLGEL